MSAAVSAARVPYDDPFSFGQLFQMFLLLPIGLLSVVDVLS